MEDLDLDPPAPKKTESAVEFLARVEITYADQPAAYLQFLAIMKVRAHMSPQTPFLPFPHLEPTVCFVPLISTSRSPLKRSNLQTLCS